MERVGARFGDHIDHRSCGVAVLGAEAVGLDAELLEGIGIGRRVIHVEVRIAVAAAVELIVDAIGA